MRDGCLIIWLNVLQQIRLTATWLSIKQRSEAIISQNCWWVKHHHSLKKCSENLWYSFWMIIILMNISSTTVHRFQESVNPRIKSQDGKISIGCFYSAGLRKALYFHFRHDGETEIIASAQEHLWKLLCQNMVHMLKLYHTNMKPYVRMR